MDIGRWYIPTEFETELCPSLIITDGMFPSVIPLVFSGFLVVKKDLVTLRLSWHLKWVFVSVVASAFEANHRKQVFGNGGNVIYFMRDPPYFAF